MLNDLQKKHSKVKDICYNSFRIQNYMTTHRLNNDEVSLLFSLRSRTVRDIKLNTPSIYITNKMCPLCEQCDDTQEHCLKCEKLTSNNNITCSYEDIYSSDIMKQIHITQILY